MIISVEASQVPEDPRFEKSNKSNAQSRKPPRSTQVGVQVLIAEKSLREKYHLNVLELLKELAFFNLCSRVCV